LVRAELSSGETLPPYPLPIEGRCADDLELVPSEFDLGIVAWGETAGGAVLLRSQAGRPFSIDSLTAEPPDWKVSFKERSGCQVEFEVALAARRAGRHKGRIQVVARSEGGAPRALELPVDALVLPPQYPLPEERGQ
jgi:hypothetical protein